MQIRKKNDTAVLFEELFPGDVFEIGGTLYMKTETPTNCYNNVVELIDGDVWHFEDDRKVYKVNCELVVE
jgi:hypothetical protein